MPFKVKKEELFTIPNILCYIRLLLVPIFAFVYLRAETPANFYTAGVILIIATVTDGIDGFLARRFNMGSDWGKMIDPIIDKILQIVVALCLCKRNPLMWAVVFLLLIKEGYMGYKGWRNLKAGGNVQGALWFGKVCTALLFITFVALVMFGNMQKWVSQSLIVLNIVVMLLALWLYVLMFQRAEADARIKERKQKRAEADKAYETANTKGTETRITKPEVKASRSVEKVDIKATDNLEYAKNNVAKTEVKEKSDNVYDKNNAVGKLAEIDMKFARKKAQSNTSVIDKVNDLK